MKSIMQHQFAQTPTIDAPRSSFDRSHGHKTTFDAGWLIPFYIDDVLPGDTFNLRTTGFARLATPEFPFMDNMYMDTHFFFVPHRLVWDNSRKFYGEQTNPTDSIDYLIPVMTSHVPALHSLSDYMGLMGATATESIEHNSLYHRGYNLIWNEWFRDQNLQTSAVVPTDDGPDNISQFNLKRRGKRHDYFTSALPWPQKGDAVSIPIGTSANVIPPTSTTQIGVNIPQVSGRLDTKLQIPISTTDAQTVAANTSASVTTMYWDAANPGLIADLTTATAATINDLRESFQVQKLLERDARGGTRYSELVKNHFGVNFYDVSYRPEFLGGGSTPLKSTPVTNNTATNALGEQGSLAAFTTAAFSGHGFSKSFVEHGFVIGLVSVRADLTYQQGVRREYKKQTRYDIYWPSLAHLGEQAILNSEIYYQGLAADDDVFGYQERYAEYRYKPSQISGLFRSQATGSIDPWHLSQEFSTLPVLGTTFIEENPPVDRIIVIPSQPHFILDTYTSLKCARPMPIYGTPGLIDHF